MLRHVTRLVGAAAVAGSVALAGAPTASAGLQDTTPPTLRVPPVPAFSTGGIVDWVQTPDNKGQYRIPSEFTVQMTDDTDYPYERCNPIVVNSVERHDGETFYYTPPVATHHQVLPSNEPFLVYLFDVTGTDCAGNATTVQVRGGDVQVFEDTATPTAAGTLGYTGSWAVSKCGCALRGTQRYSTAKGAALSFTRTYANKGQRLALVMAQGPGRGKADVFVDGSKVATLDTLAPQNTNRVITFTRAMTAGKHVVKVVNQATAGRPRIDVDAVLVRS